LGKQPIKKETKTASKIKQQKEPVRPALSAVEGSEVEGNTLSSKEG
jgi:hypothetical protein